MSLKQELQTWSDALDAFDKQDFDRAIVLFQVSSRVVNRRARGEEADSVTRLPSLAIRPFVHPRASHRR